MIAATFFLTHAQSFCDMSGLWYNQQLFMEVVLVVFTETCSILMMRPIRSMDCVRALSKERK